MKIALFLISLLFLPLFGDSSAAFPPNPYETEGGKRAPTFSEANAQAIYWINLIDQQQFVATWLEAGGLIKEVTTQAQWAAAMREIRVGLGVVTSRKVTNHHFETQLPFGTRGNFIIIQYATSYQRSPGMVETITLMTEGRLGQWKVIAYNIGRR